MKRAERAYPSFARVGAGRSCDRFLGDERDIEMSAGYGPASSAGGHSGTGTGPGVLVTGTGTGMCPPSGTRDRYNFGMPGLNYTNHS